MLQPEGLRSAQYACWRFLNRWGRLRLFFVHEPPTMEQLAMPVVMSHQFRRRRRQGCRLNPPWLWHTVVGLLLVLPVCWTFSSEQVYTSSGVVGAAEARTRMKTAAVFTPYVNRHSALHFLALRQYDCQPGCFVCSADGCAPVQQPPSTAAGQPGSHQDASPKPPSQSPPRKLRHHGTASQLSPASLLRSGVQRQVCTGLGNVWL